MDSKRSGLFYVSEDATETSSWYNVIALMGRLQVVDKAAEKSTLCDVFESIALFCNALTVGLQFGRLYCSMTPAAIRRLRRELLQLVLNLDDEDEKVVITSVDAFVEKTMPELYTLFPRLQPAIAAFLAQKENKRLLGVLVSQLQTYLLLLASATPAPSVPTPMAAFVPISKTNE